MNTVIIEIDAAPEIVFSWLEVPEKLSQWLPNIQENEILEETPERVGSTWRQVYVENGRRMEMFGTTTAYEPNKRNSCEITGKLFDLNIDYFLEDLGGRTRLTQNSVIKMKGIFKLLSFFMGSSMKKSQDKQAEDSFATLKRLAEDECTQRTV